MKVRCIGGPCHGQFTEVDPSRRAAHVLEPLEPLGCSPPGVPEHECPTRTGHLYVIQRITWRDSFSTTDRYVYLLHHEGTDPVRALGDAIALLAEQEGYG